MHGTKLIVSSVKGKYCNCNQTDIITSDICNILFFAQQFATERVSLVSYENESFLGRDTFVFRVFLHIICLDDL